MNIPPAMIELMLRSAGLPESSLQLIALIQAEGLSAFNMSPIPVDDPAWQKVSSMPGRSRYGLWLRAQGPTSCISAAIFIEGVSDAALEHLTAVTTKGLGNG